MTQIKATKKGYLVTSDGYSTYYQALVQGAVSGRRILVNYSADTPRGVNLNAPINDSGTTWSEYIAHVSDGMWQAYIADGHVRGARILAKGHVIQ